MKRSSKKTRWNLIGILILSLALSYGGFKYLYPAQPSDIFIIDPVINLEYGETSVTGELRKDVPVGEDGNFLLVLADSRVIVLDISGVDHLIGQTVTLRGNLSAAPGKDLPLTMTVNALSI